MSILTAEGSVICQLRHNLVRNALNIGCTHLLFIDSDQTFPADTLHRLAAHRKPIVAANCTTRAEPVAPVAMGMDNKRVLSQGKQGLERVRQVGTGVMMVEANIFKRLKPPFFLNQWSEELNSYSGEDIYFCYKAKAELGVNVFVDHELSLEIGHIGQRIYTHKDIDPDHEIVTREHKPVDVITGKYVEQEPKVAEG